MAQGTSYRRHFELGDFNPHVRRPERVMRQQWRKDLGEREKFLTGSEGAGELQTWTHIQPFGARAVLAHPPGDPTAVVVLPKNSGLGAFFPGQKVLVGSLRGGATVIGEPPFGERGVGLFPKLEAPAGVIDVLEISSASPSTLEAGQATLVTFAGVGFLSSPVDVIVAVELADPVEYDEDGKPVYVADALVSVGAVAFVSDVEVTATVTVDASKGVGLFVSYLPARG